MFGNYSTQPYMAPNQTVNPYLDRLNAMQSMAPAPRYEIIHVNGRRGAESLRMAPNSTCLMLDDTAPIVWLATTDGAGYPSLTPYNITPYKDVENNDRSDIEDRLDKLEAIIYGSQSNSAANESAAGSNGKAGKGKQSNAAPAAV